MSHRGKDPSPQTPGAASEGVAERLARLTTFSSDRLRAEWQRLYRVPAPRSLSRDLLLRGVAYKLQEQAFGGLPQATRRRLDTLARTLEKSGDGAFDLPPSLKPGAKLLRQWRGETHCVSVLEDGFSYRDQRYRSLTHIAKLITGAHWSGPRFFGIGQAGSAEPQRKAKDG